MKSLELNEISNKDLKLAKSYKKCHIFLRNDSDHNRVKNLEKILENFGFEKDKFDAAEIPVFKNTYAKVSFSKI
jgi:hypothetical protein